MTTRSTATDAPAAPRGRAIVAGGSLGGLNAALWLRAAGWDVEVFEREVGELSSRGAGIVLQPATVRYFVEHGGLDVEALSVGSRYLRWLHRDGSVRYEEEPCPYRFTAWNTLYRHYIAAFGREHYHLGEPLVGFDQDADSVTVRFATGREERADLLVCADGIGSVSRGLLLPDVAPSYAGYVGWRGLVDEPDASPLLRRQFVEACTYFQMSDSQLLGYPVPGHEGGTGEGERLLNWLWYRNVDAETELSELFTDIDGVRRGASVPPGFVQGRHLDELRRRAAAELPAAFAELVTQTREPFIQLILDLRSPRMAFGRIALMGDAAFAARPHAGAGTAKAADDGWALGQALRGVDPTDVAAALQRFEQRQRPVGEELVERAARAGDASQFGGSWDPADLSLRMSLTPPDDGYPRGRVHGGRSVST